MFMSFSYAKRHYAFFKESANRPSMYTRHVVWYEKLPANSETLIDGNSNFAGGDFFFLQGHSMIFFLRGSSDEIIRNLLSRIVIFTCVLGRTGSAPNQNSKTHTTQSFN